MKLEIPIIVDFDDMQSLLDDIGKLQTYKLFEGSDELMVCLEDVADVLVKHIKAKEKQPDACENTCEIERKSNDCISRQAVKYLDLFAKTYCRDYSVTDDLVFRCKECEYEMPDGKCLVKCMVRRLCPDYREFGSMGDL